MSEDLCDVWIEMFTHFVSHPECTIEDLGIQRFLDNAVDIMKNFDELMLGVFDMFDDEMVLKFSDLILNDRLYTTIVNNLRNLPHGSERSRQAGLFLLIFEVCEYKSRYYQVFRNQSSNQSWVDHQIQYQKDLIEKYEKIMNEEFTDCQEVLIVCQNTLQLWRSRTKQH